MSKLDDWILMQQAKGYSDSQIEERLVENGFDKESVDKALINLKLGNPTHVIPKSKNHGTFLWLGISSLILLVIIGGAYYYMQMQKASSMPDAKVAGPDNNTMTNACGNNILDPDEECDGSIMGRSLNESMCTDFMWNSTANYTGGNLTCTNCRHDFSMCTH